MWLVLRLVNWWRRFLFQPAGKKGAGAKKTGKGNAQASFKDDEVMKEAEMTVIYCVML